jgi:periplasmic divalent cation tolerance protein
MVTEKLAACANILPPIESIYRWEGKLEQAEEVLVFFKTTAQRYPELEAKLKELHPYDVPEITATPITAGSADYLLWVADSCS